MNNAVSSKKENKRKIILDAAFNLFMQKGYAKVKVIDIAEQAGIGKGTVYEYFKSKDDILMELVSTYVKTEFLKLGERVSALPTFRDRLLTLIKFEFDFLKRYGPHAPEIKQYVSDKDMGFSMELASAINEMVNIEYTNIANAIRFGIESGEVRECDVPTAVHFIATAIASFVVISSVDPSCDLYKGVEYGYLKKYTPEDVYDLIMNGLHA